MRKHKQPRNYEYWRYVLESQEKFKEFMKRGNGRQKKELEQTRKYYKWQKIQEKKI